MVDQSRLWPVSPSGAGFRFSMAVVSAALLSSLFTGAPACAQMTKDMLIGDSVSEMGTKYADVDEAIKRFMNRDVLAARQFLESAKKKDPNLPPVDLILAKMYFLTNNP